MDTTAWIIGILIGFAVGWWVITRRAKRTENKFDDRSEQKEENLERLRDYVKGKESVTNDDVEKLLKVSNPTATRYLNELERDGLLKQEGKTGKYTHYNVL